MVSSAWSTLVSGSSAYKVSVRLKSVLQQLLHWNKYHFGKTQTNISSLIQQLQSLQGQASLSSEDQATEFSICKDLESMMHCEAMLWAQKSQHMWLLQGDRNSKFFHALVKGRRVKQTVIKLRDDQGNWIIDYADLEQLAISNFQSVYSANDLPSSQDIQSTLQHIPIPSLSADHISHLQSPISALEVEEALFQMKPDRTPGPDGLPVLFFQSFRHIVKHDVTAAALTFFSSGYLLKEFNHTFITLIPKCDHPQSIKDFRPISLCDVFQKIISKVMVNRLQPILQDLIAPTQNGFIRGRSINDNIFVTNFFWGFKNDRPTMHLLKQPILHLPKHCGGLGIKSFHFMNQALLAKQFWRLTQNQNSLFAKWTLSKYFKGNIEQQPRSTS